MKKLYLLLLLLLFSPILVFASSTSLFKVNGSYYESFLEAYNAASLDNPLIILSDIKLDESLKISKSIEINLNGHEISAPKMVFLLNGGTLNLIGSGTVRERNPYFGAVVVKGSVDNKKDYSILNVSSEVLLEGWSGIMIDQNNKKGYGVVVNFKGKINALKDTTGDTGVGIYVNGNIKDKENMPEINLYDTSTIKSTGPGIYLAGYSKLNYLGNTEGYESGLSIKSGIVNIKGGHIVATGPDKTPTSPNGSGTNASGAGIQVESNNSYAGDIEINITNGTVESKNGNMFYEFTANNKTDTKVKSINILNGTFISKNDNFKVSDSFKTNNPKFISDGKFTSNIQEYLKTGNIKNTNNYYQVVSKNQDTTKNLVIKKTNLLPIIVIIIFLITILINIYLYVRKKYTK